MLTFRLSVEVIGARTLPTLPSRECDIIGSISRLRLNLIRVFIYTLDMIAKIGDRLPFRSSYLACELRPQLWHHKYYGTTWLYRRYGTTMIAVLCLGRIEGASRVLQACGAITLIVVWYHMGVLPKVKKE